MWAEDANNRLPVSVGNTVDVANATWTNTIGDPELITVWQGPNFDADEPAFYHARVLEIPTPRWTAYDALRFADFICLASRFMRSLNCSKVSRSFGSAVCVERHCMGQDNKRAASD